MAENDSEMSGCDCCKENELDVDCTSVSESLAM